MNFSSLRISGVSVRVIVAAVAACSALAATTSARAEVQAGNTWQKVREAGVLRCGAGITPPYVTRDAKTQQYGGLFTGRPQKRGATPISYKVLQCPTKLLHTSIFNLKNASPSQAYDCRM
jgi:hypothetical protein